MEVGDFWLGQLNVSSEQALPQLPTPSIQKAALGAPEGAFSADFSHSLLSNEFKAFLVQIPTEEEEEEEKKKVTTL